MQSISEAISLVLEGADADSVSEELYRVARDVLDESERWKDPRAEDFGAEASTEHAKEYAAAHGGAEKGWHVYEPKHRRAEGPKPMTKYRRHFKDPTTGKITRTEYAPLTPERKRTHNIADVAKTRTLKSAIEAKTRAAAQKGHITHGKAAMLAGGAALAAGGVAALAMGGRRHHPQYPPHPMHYYHPY